MEWPLYTLREVAPSIPCRNTPDPDATVWHLGLDQIEGHTGVVLGKYRAPVSDAGNSTFHLGIISMGRHVVVRIVTTPPWCFRVPIHRGDWPRAELFAAASPAAFLCLDLLKPYPA